jgi:hypothetical protein
MPRNQQSGTRHDWGLSFEDDFTKYCSVKIKFFGTFVVLILWKTPCYNLKDLVCHVRYSVPIYWRWLLRRTPMRHIIKWNRVVWASKRIYSSYGSTHARVRETRNIWKMPADGVFNQCTGASSLSPIQAYVSNFTNLATLSFVQSLAPIGWTVLKFQIPKFVISNMNIEWPSLPWFLSCWNNKTYKRQQFCLFYLTPSEARCMIKRCVNSVILSVGIRNLEIIDRILVCVYQSMAYLYIIHKCSFPGISY